jgi:hypothetical protein
MALGHFESSAIVVDPQWFQFNADPDPAFYLIADPDPGSQINADPCGLRTRVRIPILVRLSSQKKLNFTRKIRIPIKVRNRIQDNQINADPGPYSDPGQTFKSEKIEFYKKNPHSQKIPDPDLGQPNQCGSMRTRVQVRKSLIFTRKIRIPNNDPDPGEPNQCGSMRIRTHNTALSTDAARTPALSNVGH